MQIRVRLNVFYMDLLLQGGRTALMSACKGGYISVVQYLEAQGANVNAKDGVSHPVHLKFINFLQRGRHRP